jgi:hypothetical protein
VLLSLRSTALRRLLILSSVHTHRISRRLPTTRTLLPVEIIIRHRRLGVIIKEQRACSNRSRATVKYRFQYDNLHNLRLLSKLPLIPLAIICARRHT